jgi:hypothetical protein
MMSLSRILLTAGFLLLVLLIEADSLSSSSSSSSATSSRNVLSFPLIPAHRRRRELQEVPEEGNAQQVDALYQGTSYERGNKRQTSSFRASKMVVRVVCLSTLPIDRSIDRLFAQDTASTLWICGVARPHSAKP